MKYRVARLIPPDKVVEGSSITSSWASHLVLVKEDDDINASRIRGIPVNKDADLAHPIDKRFYDYFYDNLVEGRHEARELFGEK